jgi:UDP-3-O-[3-hydroxymyristoyl] glucosamine N-acyltransferase
VDLFNNDPARPLTLAFDGLIDAGGPTDADGDGVADESDLCTDTVAGPVDASGCSVAQVDVDEDGWCDIDAPSSGPNNCLPTDNCPTVSNPGQIDDNNDGFGDACVDPSVTIPPKADVDPTATVGPDTVIDKGVEVGANATVGSDVELNQDVSVGEGASVGDGAVLNKGSSVGDGASIGPGVTLESGVFIGAGVVIGPNTIIGKDTVVCAGAGAGVGDNSVLGKNNFVITILPSGSIRGGVKGQAPDDANCP